MQAIILAGEKEQDFFLILLIYLNLMPMGEMPILEIIVMQLKNAGASSIIMAVGHLHHMIELILVMDQILVSQFLTHLKISLSVQRTSKPYYEKLEENFIVLNGDLLTTLNFENLFNEHIHSNASATIATFKRTVDIDFGVLEIDSEKRLVEYKKNPL